MIVLAIYIHVGLRGRDRPHAQSPVPFPALEHGLRDHGA